MGRLLKRAAAIFFIVTDPEKSPYHLVDAGSITAYIMLSASIMGFGVMSIPLNDDPAIKGELNIPPKKYLADLVAIGRISENEVRILPRKTIEMITYHNKYGLRM
jgi:nitroreductase